jgi:hypothetical protein
MHYARWQRYGDPTIVLIRKDMTPEERYEEKVDRITTPGGCHPWTAKTNSDGYGAIRFKGRMVGAHRWGWEHYVGPIPVGMYVLHGCDQPSCQRIHPEHCHLGTHKQNMMEMAQRGRAKTQKGEDNNLAKMTWLDVRLVRRSYATGGTSYQRLAEQFGVTKQNIRMIVLGITWREGD